MAAVFSDRIPVSPGSPPRKTCRSSELTQDRARRCRRLHALAPDRWRSDVDQESLFPEYVLSQIFTHLSLSLSIGLSHDLSLASRTRWHFRDNEASCSALLCPGIRGEERSDKRGNDGPSPLTHFLVLFLAPYGHRRSSKAASFMKFFLSLGFSSSYEAARLTFCTFSVSLCKTRG